MNAPDLLKAHAFDWLANTGFYNIRNGLDRFWGDGPDDLRHAAGDFFTGFDVLLKSRLAAEHWTAVMADINKADAEGFLAGAGATTALTQSIERLGKIAGVPLDPAAAAAFETLRHTRNRAMLFRRVEDIDLTTLGGRRAELGAKQALGWSHMLPLLRESWSPLFSGYEAEISNINGGIARHAELLGHERARAWRGGVSAEAFRALVA